MLKIAQDSYEKGNHTATMEVLFESEGVVLSRIDATTAEVTALAMTRPEFDTLVRILGYTIPGYKAMP